MAGNDGHVLWRARQAVQQLQAAAVGEHEVEHEDIEAVVFEACAARFDAIGRDHLVLTQGHPGDGFDYFQCPLLPVK